MRFAIIQTVAFPIDIAHYNNQAVGQAKAMVQLGADVDYYAPFKGQQKAFEIYTQGNKILRGIPVRACKIFKNIAYYPTLIDILKQQNYDYIQVGEDSLLMTPIVLRFAKQETRARTILIQGMYRNFAGYKGIMQKLFDLLFKKAIQTHTDYVFGKTPMAIQHLVDKGYRNVRLFPIGLDQPVESDNPELEERIARFRAGYGQTYLYIGKLESRRNPSFLLKFLELLRSKGSNACLIVVGSGLELELPEHVLHIASVPNDQTHILYKNADVFLLPTSYEIYGMVVMEALYWGCPVLATPEAGPGFILDKAEYGRCEELDLHRWVAAAQEIIQMDSSSTKAIRHRYACEFFDWALLVPRFLKEIA